MDFFLKGKFKLKQNANKYSGNPKKGRKEGTEEQMRETENNKSIDLNQTV